MKSFTLRYENSHHNMYIIYNSCKIEDQLLKYMLESLIFFSSPLDICILAFLY